MRNLWLLSLLALAACATAAPTANVAIVGGGTWAFGDRAAALKAGMAEGRRWPASGSTAPNRPRCTCS